MFCIHCGKELSDDAKFCVNCGKPVNATQAAPEAGQPGGTRVAVRQDVGKVEGGQVAGSLLSGGAAPGLSSNVEQKVDTVGQGGAVVGTVVGGKDTPIHIGGQQQYGDTVQGDKISTGGGAYVAGGVNTGGGDFVGRDKRVYGDVVHGDKVGGDKVQGDKVGGDKFDVNITGSTGVAIGRNAQAYVSQGVSGDQLAALFAAVYRKIDARPEDPRVDKDELRETAQRVEKEAAKGDQANQDKLGRWLQTLENIAPDVVEVVVNALLNPGAGAASVVKKVLERFVRKS